MGSIVPDFEKFIRMQSDDYYSHTWKSIFYFNLPLGIILTLLFHLIARNMLIDNLPLFLYQRFSRYKKLNWLNYLRKHFFIVAASIIIGTLTHIIWDDFTHRDGKFVQWFHYVRTKVWIGNYRTSLYAFLQFTTSILGIIITIAAILMLPKENVTKTYHNEKKYWLIIFLVICSVVITRHQFVIKQYYMVTMVITTISAGIVSLVLAPLIIRKFSLNKFYQK